MKVLLINHFPLTGSGSGVYTRNIANSLTRKGHEVCIVFPENETVISDEKFKLHPVYFKNQEIIEGQLPFNFPCFTTHPRSNKTFYDLPEAELNMYKMAFTQAIEEEIKDFRPDIIHVGHIWVLSKLAAKYNIPLIITAHGTDLIGYNKSERYRDDAKDAALMAHTIITISHENQELVKQTFDFVAPKTLLVPNGYDPEIFYKGDYSKRDVLKHFGIQRDYDKIVSFAGKFTHFKGIDILLKAAKEYEHPDTITILAVDGELFDDMKILAAELKLQNIKFVGNQPHDILRRLYNANKRIFKKESRTKKENI